MFGRSLLGLIGYVACDISSQKFLTGLFGGCCNVFFAWIGRSPRLVSLGAGRLPGL